jgi:acyl-coenzyme A synthetase/AMP-(fatty) acid ligase
MMSLNGINIFPAEIERVLDAHPAVKESAAFPVSSALLGDIPAAAVELRVAGSVVAESLVAYARERLGVRAPRRIAVLEALPRNAAGKIMKSDLAKRFVAGQFDT